MTPDDIEAKRSAAAVRADIDRMTAEFDAKNGRKPPRSIKMPARVVEKPAPATPAERARKSYAAGAAFFEHVAVVEQVTGGTFFGSAYSEITSEGGAHVADLGGIEDEGWQLFDVGYVWVHLKSSSSNRPLLTGERTAESGYTQAIYLFRRSAKSDPKRK